MLQQCRGQSRERLEFMDEFDIERSLILGRTISADIEAFEGKCPQPQHYNLLRIDLRKLLRVDLGGIDDQISVANQDR